jgi:hypothetical protein
MSSQPDIRCIREQNYYSNIVGAIPESFHADAGGRGRSQRRISGYLNIRYPPAGYQVHPHKQNYNQELGRSLSTSMLVIGGLNVGYPAILSIRHPAGYPVPP